MTLMIDHIRVIYMASSFADKARREREREREREMFGMFVFVVRAEVVVIKVRFCIGNRYTLS